MALTTYEAKFVKFSDLFADGFRCDRPVSSKLSYKLTFFCCDMDIGALYMFDHCKIYFCSFFKLVFTIFEQSAPKFRDVFKPNELKIFGQQDFDSNEIIFENVVEMKKYR